MKDLKNLSMEELCLVKNRIEQEIDERVNKEFEEDCKTLAHTLRNFLRRGYNLQCYINIECEHCYCDTKIDLWDYIENIVGDLERNCE